MNFQQNMIDDGGGGPVATFALNVSSMADITNDELITTAQGGTQQQEEQFAPSADSAISQADHDVSDTVLACLFGEFAFVDLPQLEDEMSNGRHHSGGCDTDGYNNNNNGSHGGRLCDLISDLREYKINNNRKNVEWLESLSQQQSNRDFFSEVLVPINPDEDKGSHNISHHQSPMSEDSSSDNWHVDPPPPLVAPSERSSGKRKHAVLAGDARSAPAHGATLSVKRKRAAVATPRAPAASRAGKDHSKKSRSDINDGILPYVTEVQQMWHDQSLREKLVKHRVAGRKVDDRLDWAKSLSQDVREHIASQFLNCAIPTRVPEILGAFVWLEQQGCTNIVLVSEVTHCKEIAKLVGSRPCGCCTFSITLETCSQRWDDLKICKEEMRRERRLLKQQLKQKLQLHKKQ